MIIDPTGRGDITETHVRAHLATGGPYVPSPLVFDGSYLLVPGDNGMMRFVGPQGDVVIKHRLKDRFTASPVGAGDRIYWVSERARTYVIDASGLAGAEPGVELVAVNELEGKCLASPAAAGGRMFIRTDQALFCIAGAAAVDQPARKVAAGPSTFAELKKRYDEHQAEEGDAEALAVRMETVEEIAKLDDPEVIGFMLEAIKKDHWDVSEEGVRLLGRRGKAAIPALIELLKDGRPFIRCLAAENLGSLEAVTAVPALIETAEDDKPLVRSAALRSLGQIGRTATEHDDRIVAVLIGALEDADGVTRQAAIDGLGMLAARAAGQRRGLIVEGLLDALADRNGLVVGKARKVLADAYKVSDDVILRDEFLYGSQRKDSIVRQLRAGPMLHLCR